MEKMSRELKLSIVVSTIPGREDWLSECLSSIRAQRTEILPRVIVSGNGTTQMTKRIVESFGFDFVHHQQMMTAEQHGELLLSSVAEGYTWLIADDDLLSANAMRAVIDAIQANPECVAILGKHRSFTRPEDVGLGAAQPEDWQVGVYRNFSEVVAATHGDVALGCFVLYAPDINCGNYRRYLGTSHAIFGHMWDYMLANAQQGVVVAPDVFIETRRSVKAWDESYIATGAGLRKFRKLLPAELSADMMGRRSRLPPRELGRVAWLYEVEDRKYLNDWARNYIGLLSWIAPSIVPVLSPLAKLIKVALAKTQT